MMDDHAVRRSVQCGRLVLRCVGEARLPCTPEVAPAEMPSMLLIALCVVVFLASTTSAADSETKPLRRTTDDGAAPKRRPMGRDALPEAEIAKRRLMNDRENGKRARRL